MIKRERQLELPELPPSVHPRHPIRFTAEYALDGHLLQLMRPLHQDDWPHGKHHVGFADHPFQTPPALGICSNPSLAALPRFQNLVNTALQPHIGFKT
ncbi:hypothetical protein ColLi_13815 [Colletotrichum liriopes]|uniref:Uncharacterized protein n=1 Tax=Colletotrichum liriopes TaxID=708192 RepID=A0AA37H322_9PEZI|nr:hypothetical protein ColLi_13815 [Colletotrichum liriopes]